MSLIDPKSSRRRERPRRATVEAMEGRALLATFAVTSLADAGPGSLREAIDRANLEPDRDTITFAADLAGTITIVAGLPDLLGGLDVIGPGAGILTVARDPGIPDSEEPFRIITVAEGADVVLSGLTLSGGRGGFAAGSDSLVGGGVFNAGTMTMTDAVVAGNRLDFREGSGPLSPRGGGIANVGTMTIERSVIRDNVGSHLAVSARPIVEGTGGGIDNAGTMTLRDSTVAGNLASSGGGIANSGTMTIERSAVVGNDVSGLFNPPGAAVENGGTLTIVNTTVSGHGPTASPTPGAPKVSSTIENSGTLSMRFATLSNTAPGVVNAPSGSLDLTSSLIRQEGEAGASLVNRGGTVTSGGGNLLSDDPGVPLGPTDQVGIDPMLAPLGDYGGPTQTHALMFGSPALDAGEAAEGVTTDQRGVARPQGSAPDIGAFEQQAVASIIIPERDFPNGPVGVPRTVGATFLAGPGVQPLAGVPVTVRIVSGPNAGASGTIDPADGRTDASGRIRFTYDGPNGPGVDTIVITAMTDDRPVVAPPITVRRFLPATTADYDGDGRSDFAVSEADPATGGSRFVIEQSGGGTITQPFGGVADRPIVGDFDGDGTTDLAVFGFSPIDGFSRYALIRSSDGVPSLGGFGGPADRPVIGDFDGDGRSDLAVFGPGPDGNNRFAVLPSSDPAGAYVVPFGGPGDLPLAGDFDGDGLDDLAVYGYSPLDGFSRFAVRPSGDPSAGFAVPFGGAGDGPVVGDFDGDGADDLTVYGYSPLDGFSRFAIRPSSIPDAAYPVAFGGGQDAPIGADYDGDGRTDVAVYGFSPLDGAARFAAIRSSDGRPIVRPLGTADSNGLPIAPGRFRPPSMQVGEESARLRAAPVVAMEDVGPGASAVGPMSRRPQSETDWGWLFDEALGQLGQSVEGRR